MPPRISSVNKFPSPSISRNTFSNRVISWLVSKGRIEEARAVFVKYHAGGDEASPLVDFEMQEIMQHLENGKEGGEKTPWKEMLRTKANRRRTIIAVLLGFYSQWSGTGLVSITTPQSGLNLFHFPLLH